MLAKIPSASVIGIEGYMAMVEVDIRHGMPAIITVGLPDAAVKEAKDRVESAIRNSGYSWPSDRITINYAPGDIRKEGPAFDLPTALGMLAASGQLQDDLLGDYAAVGELALDGALRPVRGCLAAAMACREDGLRGFIVPGGNANEAGVVAGLEVIPVGSLTEAVGFLAGQLPIEPVVIEQEAIFEESSHYDIDFADVRGQEAAKRALTVAAAGGHNVIMIGPPGSGKTMLARRLPTILPMLSLEESLETTRIYSSVGLLGPGKSILATRPFRSPHHTISHAGLVGGGSVPTPGEVSLAHNGVLFLDELPEFDKKTLEVLRQPLEDGMVSIVRVQGSMTFPANISLVAALNPCPCGYFGDPRHECRCTPRQIQNYMGRISGPLLDRIRHSHRGSGGGLPRPSRPHRRGLERRSARAGCPGSRPSARTLRRRSQIVNGRRPDQCHHESPRGQAAPPPGRPMRDVAETGHPGVGPERPRPRQGTKIKPHHRRPRRRRGLRAPPPQRSHTIQTFGSQPVRLR